MPSEIFKLKLFYDGACPLCSREIRFLKRLDKNNSLKFEDISQQEFDPTHYAISRESFLSEMHGLLPDGSVIKGMEVFRQAYKAVGLGWLLAPTGWTILKPCFDWLYKKFAYYRPRFSRVTCGGNSCQLPK